MTVRVVPLDAGPADGLKLDRSGNLFTAGPSCPPRHSGLFRAS